MGVWIRALGKLALLGSGLLLAVGSGSEGERAETGACPTGETCSNRTPSGLYFQGPGCTEGCSGIDVQPTAVMGRQTITIDPVDWLTHLYDFDAECDGPTYSIASLDPPEVTVRAQEEGSVYLRILQSGTSLLYDRLLITAHKPSHVSVGPRRRNGIFLTGPSTDLFYGGTPVSFVAKIYSAGQARLIDEDLAFEPVDATTVASMDNTRWDVVDVVATQGATSLSMRARTADGTTGEGSALLTWEIDDISDQGLITGWPATIALGTYVTEEFYGEFGGRAVSGVPFSFRLYNPEGGAVPEDLIYSGSSWVHFTPDHIGTWTLSVEGPGATKDFEITVVDSLPSPPPPEPAPESGSGYRSEAAAPWAPLRILFPEVARRFDGPGSPGSRAAVYLAGPEASSPTEGRDETEQLD